MKLGFEFRDDMYSNKDFSRISNGNPGVGGTQYEFALLAYYLLKIKSHSEIQIVFFHKNKNKFEEGVDEIFYQEMNDIPNLAKENDIDILIYVPIHDDIWYERLENSGIKSIAWAHNFIDYKELINIHNCQAVKSVVAVSKEQFELLSAEDCFDKCTYIYNMVDCTVVSTQCDLKKKNVCYMGAIRYAKGFHVLAKNWKRIISRVPSANLFVLGSGKLHSDDEILGSYGIANIKYEKKIMPYLTDKNGRILNSVHFLGNVGEEKNEILRDCRVGVVNPTAYSETFCISAIEMAAQGVPVCTKNKYGLKNTVKDGYSGLLFKNNSEFVNDIIRLLTDDKLYHEFHENSYKHALTFSGERLIDKWIELIDCVNSCKPFKQENVDDHVIRATIGKLRKKFFFKWIITPYHFEYINLEIIKCSKNLAKFILKKLGIYEYIRKRNT